MRHHLYQHRFKAQQHDYILEYCTNQVHFPLTMLLTSQLNHIYGSIPPDKPGVGYLNSTYSQFPIRSNQIGLITLVIIAGDIVLVPFLR